MNFKVRLCNGGRNKKFFQVLEIKYSSDDFDVDDEWILIKDAVNYLNLGPLIFDADKNILIKKPEQKIRGEVFDIDTCSWVMSEDAQWVLIREKRDALLSDTDWMIARWQEKGQALPSEWAAYRQALRDITLQPDPFAIDWPAAPANQSTEAPTEAQH